MKAAKPDLSVCHRGGMDALDLARWQFGVTTVYHFLFVPLTIGLSVAGRDPADRLGTAPATSSTCG